MWRSTYCDCFSVFIFIQMCLNDHILIITFVISCVYIYMPLRKKHFTTKEKCLQNHL